MNDVIIVCDDLFGLEIYSILKQINIFELSHGRDLKYNIIGYISDTVDPFGAAGSSLKRLGCIRGWKPLSDETYVLGIKMPENKPGIVESLSNAGCKFETVRARWMLALALDIGEGSVVAAYSIKSGIKIGKFVTLVGSMLTSKSVGDFSTVMRFSNITGDVGAGTYIGNHVYLHTGKNIGDNCFVSDGSIVVKNVKSGLSVSGVPAKKNC